MKLFDQFFKPRVHESVAISALLAVSLALHAAWLSHLILFRVPELFNRLFLSDTIGPIFIVYTLSLGVGLGSFLLFRFLLRCRDCTELRDRAFWFFVVSLIMFLVLTFPFVYVFEIAVSSV